MTSPLTRRDGLLAIAILLALVLGACRIDSGVSPESSEGVTAASPVVAPSPDVEPTAVPTATVDPADVPTPEPTAVPDRAATPDATDSGGSDPDTSDPDTSDPDGEGSNDAGFDDERIALDAAVRSGELDNGLRYFVRRNVRPGAQAQLRLVVEAGSIHEPDDVAGIAHFTEHMLFNGTNRFPNNELIPVLEGFGAAFGPDVNAYTSFEETVYSLVVPSRNPETVQLAVDVLREWAGEATLTSEAVVAERGVVREELRLFTESASSRVTDLLFDVMLTESAFDAKLPIGTAEAVESMSADDVRAFYDTWYRPDRMAVIAVGDFDPEEMERRIVQAFEDLEPRAEAPLLELDLGSGPLPVPTFDVFLDDEIDRPDIEVLWRFDHVSPTSPSAIRRLLLGQVMGEMLDQRFFELVQGGESSLIERSFELSSFTSNFQLISAGGSAEAEMVTVALTDIVTEFERARQHGFDDVEFARAIETVQALLAQEYAERATQQDVDIANALVEYSLDRGLVVSSDDKFAVYTEALASLTPADAQALVDEIISGEPYVLMTGPSRMEAALPEPEDLAESFNAAIGVPVEARAQSSAAPDQLMARPEPAEITSIEEISAIDATVVTFENGARMAYRPTTIADNFVEFSAVSEGGFFVTDGPETPLLGTISGWVLQSGFQSIDAVTLGQITAGSSVSLTGAVGRSYERLGGASAATDLETLFQLAHLQMTEPVLEPAQVRQFRESMRPLAADPGLRPNIAAGLELWTLRYGDSPWYRYIPTVEDIDTLDADLLRDAWAERFSNAGDFVFLFAGDIDEDEIIDLGARYLGTLPATDEREDVPTRDPGIPEENIVSVVEAGISDQGVVTWNWESPYPYTIEDRVIADLLLVVVNARLRDRIREELGASYSPAAETVMLSQPEPWIDTTLQVSADPERLAEVSEAVRQELANIRAGEIDPGYLSRAIDQQVEEYRFFANGDWLDELEVQLLHSDREDDEIWRRPVIAGQVTLDDIVAAARVVFPEARSLEVRLVPAS